MRFSAKSPGANGLTINKTVSSAFFLRACNTDNRGMSHLCLHMCIMWVPLYFVSPRSVRCACTTVK